MNLHTPDRLTRTRNTPISKAGTRTFRIEQPNYFFHSQAKFAAHDPQPQCGIRNKETIDRSI
ncbi:MAG: hypothetical protein WKF92_16445 [Pyrinomonadaceae bacterium]